MVVACSYKILWPKIDFWHILACFGQFLECKKAQNWNGQPTIVYGSINLKKILGGPDTYTKLPCEERSPNPIFFFFGSVKVPYGLIITENDLLCKNLEVFWFWLGAYVLSQMDWLFEKMFSSFFSYFGNFWWFSEKLTIFEFWRIFNQNSLKYQSSLVAVYGCAKLKKFQKCAKCVKTPQN